MDYFRTPKKIKSLIHPLSEENVMKLDMTLCNCHISDNVTWVSQNRSLDVALRQGPSDFLMKGEIVNILNLQATQSLLQVLNCKKNTAIGIG